MRGLGFEWQVAVRFLREGRFQTWLIMFGVAAGVARLDPGDCIIGLQLASDLGVRPGDKLTVQTGTITDAFRSAP